MTRAATIARNTHETKITLALDLDTPHADAEVGSAAEASGTPRGIHTGVGFFDHMLTHVAKHGRLALAVDCVGDTHIDDHHTVEDVGIAFGQALDKALGDKRGIERYGHSAVPMDETLARVALDLSGRPALVFKVNWTHYAITPLKPRAEAAEAPDRSHRSADPSSHPPLAIPGQDIRPFDVQLVKEFFNAVANNARMNLHLEVPWGENNHHIAEALFKAFGRALRMAIAVTHQDIPSTKGTL